ncbi:MAG: redoxin domain-containing protein [Pseudomonadota bacterium]
MTFLVSLLLALTTSTAFAQYDVGKVVSDFTMPSVVTKDAVIDLKEVREKRGVKVVWLTFLRASCSKCNTQIDDLLAVGSPPNDRIAFVTVFLSPKASEEYTQGYARGAKIDWPAGYDRDGKIASLFGVTDFPAHVVIDTKGEVIDTQVGPLSKQQVKDKIDAALKKVGTYIRGEQREEE